MIGCWSYMDSAFNARRIQLLRVCLRRAIDKDWDWEILKRVKLLEGRRACIFGVLLLLLTKEGLGAFATLEAIDELVKCNPFRIIHEITAIRSKANDFHMSFVVVPVQLALRLELSDYFKRNL